MKVRMIAQISGTRNGKSWPLPGGTVDLPKEEALELIRGGLATTHDDREVVEGAVPAEGDIYPRVEKRVDADGHDVDAEGYKAPDPEEAPAGVDTVSNLSTPAVPAVAKTTARKTTK